MPRMYSGPEKFKVQYLGGHTKYPKEMPGTLEVTEGYVSFKSSDGKVKFGFPIEKIQQARMRTLPLSMDWGRAGVWPGLAALLWRKKYLQIIYQEKDGTVQAVDFDFLSHFLKKRFMELLPSTKKE